MTKIFKVTFLVVGAAMLLALALLPAGLAEALVDSNEAKAISSAGSSSPDIEISGDGTYVAVAYFRRGGNQGIYLKYGTSLGWSKSAFLGTSIEGNPRVAFHPSQNRLYVVWPDTDARRVEYAQCNLVANPTGLSPDCTGGTVYDSGGTANVGNPDIVVDNTGRLHVAWVDVSPGNILSRYLSSGASSWSIVTTLSSGSSNYYQKPVLAWSGDKVHLAFVSGSESDIQTAINYRNANKSTPFWNGDSHSVAIQSPVGIGINASNHSKVDQPTLAASGDTVYLAWDVDDKNTATFYGLMYTRSTDGGANWINPKYIENNTANDSYSALDRKRSLDTFNPVEESRLRPSLVISPSGKAALVWQVRPDQCPVEEEPGTGTHQTIYGYGDTTGWMTDTLVADIHDNNDETILDPDLVVGPDGTKHFAFMKETDPYCPDGADPNRTVIYYQGPFQANISVDEEETPGGSGGIYLPLVYKAG